VSYTREKVELLTPQISIYQECAIEKDFGGISKGSSFFKSEEDRYLKNAMYTYCYKTMFPIRSPQTPHRNNQKTSEVMLCHTKSRKVS
jgi:hypothetical protein